MLGPPWGSNPSSRTTQSSPVYPRRRSTRHVTHSHQSLEDPARLSTKANAVRPGTAWIADFDMQRRLTT